MAWVRRPRTDWDAEIGGRAREARRDSLKNLGATYGPVSICYHSPMFARRSLWAGLFATVLLLGAIDWHPAGEPPHAFVPNAGEIYFPSASHPGQSAHFEAATPAQRPACPVCLHNLQTGGAHLRPVAALIPPDPEAAATPNPASLPARGCHRASGARGPPSFS